MATNDEINTALEQMKLDTIQQLRESLGTDDAGGDDKFGTENVGTAQILQGPQGPLTAQNLNQQVLRPISIYLGDNGAGLTNDAARLWASRQNRINDDDTITYSAEQHGDPSLPKQWAVVGRALADPSDETVDPQANAPYSADEAAQDLVRESRHGQVDSPVPPADQQSSSEAVRYPKQQRLKEQQSRKASSSTRAETSNANTFSDVRFEASDPRFADTRSLTWGQKAQQLLDSADHWISEAGDTVQQTKDRWINAAGGLAVKAMNQQSTADSALSRQSDNQYPDYDLGTQDGMRKFLDDISFKRGSGEAVSPNELNTAKTILSSYYGITGTPDHSFAVWDNLTMAQADAKYAKKTEPYAKAARWDDAKERLVNAAQAANVDAAILTKIAAYESSFKPDARPISTSHPEKNTQRQFDGTMALSTGYGYGQFLDDSWAGAIRDYGEKYGVPGAKTMTNAGAAAYRNDKDLQAAMLAEFTKSNIAIGRKIGGLNDDANVYALHNLGSGDGPKFLQALRTQPDTPVGEVLSKSVIRNNESLYKDGSISVAQAYRNMAVAMANGNAYADEATKMQASLAARKPAKPPTLSP